MESWMAAKMAVGKVFLKVASMAYMMVDRMVVSTAESTVAKWAVYWVCLKVVMMETLSVVKKAEELVSKKVA